MEELFKQNLLSLREGVKAGTFAEALFGNVTWSQNKSSPKKAPTVASPQFTEKEQVLDSLERFAQEKIEALPEKRILIEGGEIGLKPEPTWDGVEEYKNRSELLSSLQVDPQLLNLSFTDKTQGQVKILFVSESFRTFEEVQTELKEGFINQLLPAFPHKTAELFGRMLGAMKLAPEEVLIYPCEFQEQDNSAEVMRVAAFYKPEVIVTLGATATHKILKGQERLAMVHGQFFTRKIENIGTFTVVPLFHPSIIENNQNMKKTAWTDMQKIMKHLKKL